MDINLTMNIGKSRFFKIYYFITLLIAFFLPLNKKIIPILIIILVINWLIEGNFKEKFAQAKNTSLAVLFGSLYIIHVIGLLYSDNIDFAMFDLEIKLSILIFPLLFFTSPTFDQKKIQKILFSFIFGCFLAFLICISRALYLYVQDHQILHFFAAYFSILHHSGYFSMYLNFAIAIIIYFLIKH